MVGSSRSKSRSERNSTEEDNKKAKLKKKRRKFFPDNERIMQEIQKNALMEDENE
jgi:hypothetical protein